MAIKANASRRNKTKRPAGAPSAVEGEQLALGGEMLRSALGPSQGGVYFLPIDEIILRKGWKTYREMRNDEQVKATLAFKKVLIGGRTWEIKPKDDSEQAKEIASFVEANLKRFNFRKMIDNALTCLDFGFSLGEVVYEAAMYNGSRAIMLKDIKHRDPQSIQIKQDDHGNITGFRQQQIGQVVDVGTDGFWHYAHQSVFGNAYGVSDLRAAYRAWWAKRFIINFWNVFLERMGAPMTMMKYPQGAPEDLKTTLKQILRNLNSKTEILVPEGVTVELVEAQRTGKGDYDAALGYMDTAIAKALLMVAILGLSSAEGGRTADSQSRLHLRVLFKMADNISQDLIFSFMDQVVKPLVDMNFVHDDMYPTFIWQDYGAFEGIEIAEAIKNLHTAGVLDLDQNDVNYVRSIIGLPLRGEDDEPDEVLRPAPPPITAPDANTPAPQGNANAKKDASRQKTEDDGSS